MFGINNWIGMALFGSCFISFFIAIYAIDKKDVPTAKPFAMLCIASGLYSFGYGMELQCDTVERILFWNFIQRIGIDFTPVLWTIIAFRYCDREQRLTTPLRKAICVLPALFLLIRATNSIHYLFYTDYHIASNGYFPVIVLEKGPLYFLNIVYTSIFMLIPNALYAQLLIRSKGSFRKQGLWMLVASLFPYIAGFIWAMDRSPLGIDLTPIASTFSFICIMVVLFRYRFFDLRPLAHDKVFECMKDGVVILGPDLSILDWNPAASEIFTDWAHCMKGKNVCEMLMTAELEDAIKNSKDLEIQWNKGKLQMYYRVKGSALYERGKEMVGYLLMFHDVTKQVDSMKELHEAATTDVLTGVYSRRYFFERCQQYLSQPQKDGHTASMIMFDIDFFKEVNDQYGHQNGDKVLQQVAEICKEILGEEAMLGRFGGEEFLVFLPETEMEEAVALAEAMRCGVEKMVIPIDSENVKITMSFGVSASRKLCSVQIDDFIRAADEALYRAKNGGRNCVEKKIVDVKRYPGESMCSAG